MVEISAGYLKDLEDSAAKLQALENGGVDNWSFYSESLKEYHKDKEKDEAIDNTVAEILDCLGDLAYEPSEHGAGIAFHKDAEAEVERRIRCLLKELKDV